MARTQKLKVFRTPIGFHDAYVAAPSRKAALEAWGSNADLFARGVAEQVDDPDLMAEALADPGKVVRRSRGDMAAQLAALPEDRPKARKAVTPDTKVQHKSSPTRRAAAAKKSQDAVKRKHNKTPRPDRDALDRALRALEDEELNHAERLAGLKAREAELARERRALETEHDRTAAQLAKAAEKAQSAYDRAMRAWAG